MRDIHPATDTREEGWALRLKDVCALRAGIYCPARSLPLTARKRGGSPNGLPPPRALTKPTTAKIALIYKKSEAIFASYVSCTCILRSLTSK